MNRLFPIFVKLERLDVLLVGGGAVGLEKLTAILDNCPDAKISIVADKVKDEIWALSKSLPNVTVHCRKFDLDDLDGRDLVFLATDNRRLHEKITLKTRAKKILTNVADTPDLCDFYLGSIVRKGDLKIGISTNGKSPTVAKRLKEWLNDVIPEDIQPILDKMHKIRDEIKGDFQDKVKALNKITEGWLDKKETQQ